LAYWSYCARYNEDIQITDALMTLTKEGKVIVYKFQGARFDCGSAKGFVIVINFFTEI
jgi:UTP--glucose-1-phosphate uridylyltransferase